MSEMTITNPAAQEQPGLELRIFKHNLSTRIMHLCVAIGFMYCGVTGLLLFFGAPVPRSFVALSHCLLGVLFISAPAVYVVANFQSFSRFMGTIFHYDRDDVGWIAAPMGGYLDPYLFRNKPPHYVPPQEKYNTGQKLAGICLVLGGVMLAITGFLMWANAGEGIFGLVKVDIGPGGTWFIWTLHYVMALLMLAVFAVHFFLGAIYKETNVEFGTMFKDGTADYAYTKKKHGKWLQSLEVIDEEVVEDTPEYLAQHPEAKQAASGAAQEK